MRYDHSYHNGCLLIRLEGELDHCGAETLRREVDGLVDKYRPALLKLDYGQVGFMDSAGIGFILGRYKRMKAHDGRVEIKNARNSLKRIFRMACIDRLMHVD